MTRQGGWPSTGFRDILKRLRLERAWSQDHLAMLAGCHKQTISNLERGKQEPVWPLVLALAEALGVEVTAFKPPATKGRKR